MKTRVFLVLSLLSALLVLRAQRSGGVGFLATEGKALAAMDLNLAGDQGADFNGDGTVNFPDFIEFARNYGRAEGHAAFDPKYDLNDDGEVNFPDFIRFASSFGESVESEPQIVTGEWSFNQEALGDGFVSIRISQDAELEGRVNGGDWVASQSMDEGALLRLPLDAFQQGENTIAVRVKGESGEASVVSQTLWQGQYASPDGGETSFNLSVNAEGERAADVVVWINNAGSIEDPEDDTQIPILPDGEGNIVVTGLPATGGINIPSQNYEMYTIGKPTDQSAGQHFDETVDLRPIVPGTRFFGRLLKTTDFGNVPFTGEDGAVWLHPHHGPVATVAMFTQQPEYNAETGAYEIAGLAGGLYSMPASWPSAGVFLNIPGVSVEPGAARELDITLEGRKGTVSGAVNDADGNPVPDCSVRMVKDMNFGGVVTQYHTAVVQTDGDGRFTMETFYGEYTVMASRTNPDIYDPESAEGTAQVTVGATPAEVEVVLGSGHGPVPTPYVGTWVMNQETLGDKTVSVGIYRSEDLEGRVNEGAWTAGERVDRKVILRFPLASFQEGENLIEARVIGNADGPPMQQTVWRGPYASPGDGDTGYDLTVYVGEVVAQDGVVHITDSTDDTSVYILPGGEGNVKVRGLTAQGGAHISSERYESYSAGPGSGVSDGETWTYRLNLRAVAPGTKVFGKFLKRNDAGDVPFTPEDGDAILHLTYADGERNVPGVALFPWGPADPNDIRSYYDYATGSYEIRDLAGGTYSWMATSWVPAGVFLSVPSFYVEPGTAKEINVTLEARMGSVSGYVLDGSGIALPNCFVRLVKYMDFGVITPYHTPTMQTDGDGRFTMETFYGDYTVMASRTNPDIYDPESAEGTAQVTVGATPAEVEVVLSGAASGPTPITEVTSGIVVENTGWLAESELGASPGIVTDIYDNVWVASWDGSRITRLAPDGSKTEYNLSSFLTTEPGDPGYFAQNLTSDTDGNVYAGVEEMPVDNVFRGNAFLIKIPPSGTPVRVADIGTVYGLEYYGGYVYVGGNADERVMRRVDASGQVEVYLSGYGFLASNDFTFDGSGNAYFAVPADGSIIRVDPSGNTSPVVTGMTDSPTAIAYCAALNRVYAMGTEYVYWLDLSDMEGFRFAHGIEFTHQVDVNLGLGVDSSGSVYKRSFSAPYPLYRIRGFGAATPDPPPGEGGGDDTPPGPGATLLQVVETGFPLEANCDIFPICPDFNNGMSVYDGGLYLTSWNSRQVTRISLSDHTLEPGYPKRLYPAQELGDFIGGIAMDPEDGAMWICQINEATVRKYDASGSYTGSSVKVAVESQLSNVIVDGGKLYAVRYVFNTKNLRVYVIDKTGLQIEGTIEIAGLLSHEEASYADLFLYAGKLYVVTGEMEGVLRMDLDGSNQEILHVGGSPYFGIKGICIQEDRIYLNSEQAEVVVTDLSGKILNRWPIDKPEGFAGTYAGIEVADGKVYIASQNPGPSDKVTPPPHVLVYQMGGNGNGSGVPGPTPGGDGDTPIPPGEFGVTGVTATSGYTVEVEFSDPVDEATATNLDNYEIAYHVYHLNITSAEIGPTGKAVTLTTSNSMVGPTGETVGGDLSYELYRLTVRNVQGVDGNAVAPAGQTVRFAGSNPIGTGNWGDNDGVRITGAITGVSGEPLGGVAVSVVSFGPDGDWGTHTDDSDDIALAAITDAVGAYSLTGLPVVEGGLSWAAEKEGYKNTWDFALFSIGPDGTETRSFSVSVRKFQVVPGTRLEGRFVDPQGQPAWGHVQLRRTIDGLSMLVAAIFPDQETGVYSVDALAGGVYQLHFQAGPDGTVPEPESIMIEPGTVVTRNFTITSGGIGSSVLRGFFHDGPVQGLQFVSGEQSGITGPDGAFSYEEGSTVRFSIGDIVLGEAPGRSVMTPVDLVSGAEDESDTTVTNISRLLQTLDDDADPSNGILIAEAVSGSASGKALDFARSVEAFEGDAGVRAIVSDLTALTGAGVRELRPVDATRSHLRDTLLELLAGTYRGTYAGDADGLWRVVIDADGSITGEGRTAEAASFDITGQVQSSGSANLATGVAGETGAGFSGSITSSGAFTGTWLDETTGGNGTFEGMKEERIPIADPDQIVTFPDPGIEAAIRWRILKPTGDILRSDVESLTTFAALFDEIVSLEGIENLRSLENLKLIKNQIRDISPLGGLMHLTDLDISDNKVSDISPLGGLTNLTHLRINNNWVTDVSPLANLTALRVVNLSGNPTLRDISALTSLTALVELGVVGDQISDISPLSNLTGLTHLYLEDNPLADLSPLVNLRALERLSLNGDQITDISVLANLTALKNLHLSYTSVSDLTPLAGLTALEVLWLNGNKISDLSPLSGLTQLQELWLENNQISDISALVANPGLGAGDVIHLSRNPLSEEAIANQIPALESRGAYVGK